MKIIKTIEAEIFLDSIYEQREKIIKAFIAQYKCKPDEIEQVVEYTGNSIKWFVRKRNNSK